jgi:hypothetical protein
MFNADGRHVLDTDAHRQGRLDRKVVFVTWVERADAHWCELDAESASHANVLAREWIRPELGARGASSRKVDLRNGRTKRLELHTPPIEWPDEAAA